MKGTPFPTRQANEASPPALQRSVVQLQCVTCGAEANASCSCGKPYMPRVRAREALAEHPEKSDRAIAAAIGVSPTTVGKARDQLSTAGQFPTGNDLEPRTGMDGRTRRMPSYITEPNPEPVRQDLIDQAMKLCRDMDTETLKRFDGAYQRLTRTRLVISF